MSLCLAGKLVSAVLNPSLSINLLSRARALANDVSPSMSVVELPVTVSFLGQEASTSLSFTVVDEDIAADLVLGCQWESWCLDNKGLSIRCPTFILC